MKNNKNKITLIESTIISLVKIITLFNFIALIILFSYQFVTNRKSLKIQSKILFEQIKQTIAAHIWTYDEEEINKLLDFYIKYDFVFQIQLFYPPYFQIRNKNISPNFASIYEEKIFYENKEIGFIKIIFFYDKYYYNLIYKYFIYFFIFFIYSVLIIFLMKIIHNKKLKKTFDELKFNLESISKGYYKVKIESSPYSDINNILESFNRMIEQIEKRENELKNLYNYFKNTLNHFPSFVLICDSTFYIEFLNKKIFEFIILLNNINYIKIDLSNLFNLNSEEILNFFPKNYKIYDLFPFLDEKEINDNLLKSNQFSKINFQLNLEENFNKSNINNININIPVRTEYYLNIYIDSVFIGDDKKYIIRIDDNTEIYLAYKKLSYLDKVNNLSLFIGQITHDFNNIISTISFIISDIKEYLSNSKITNIDINNLEDNILQNINIIDNSLIKAKELSQKLLKFSKPAQFTHSKSEKINIIKLLRDLIVIPEKFSRNIEILLINELNYEPLIFGDISLIENAFLNIIINSIHAMTIMKKEKGEKEGGVLKIIINKVNKKDYKNIIKNNSDYILIQFIDNGVGIKKENLNKIFEPYFTTKREEIGTGLGLFMVHSTINLMNGFIEVNSEEGIGTKFEIFLPEYIE